MKRIVSTIALLLAGIVVHAEPLRDDHPFIGTWTVTLADGKCQETYRVRKNGTSFATSGEEVSESAFTISDKPDTKGFYKWVDRITKVNGKKDCTGQIMPVGSEATNYILIHPDGSNLLMCDQQDRNTCVGPFRRIKDGDA